MYYFAYGSNMNTLQMLRRCPAANIIGSGFIANWELKERLYADVSRKKGKFVHGLLWEITGACEKSLDFYEGVNVGLYKKIFVTVHIGQQKVKAMMYIMTEQAAARRDGEPFSHTYKVACYIGAYLNSVPVNKLFHVFVERNHNETKKIGVRRTKKSEIQRHFAEDY